MDAKETAAKTGFDRLIEVLTKPRGTVGKIRQVREQAEKQADEMWHYTTVNHENTWFQKACKGKELDD